MYLHAGHLPLGVLFYSLYLWLDQEIDTVFMTFSECKHTLWRAFVDALIELNDGREGSSKNHILFQSRPQLKSHTLIMINMTKLDTLFITKMAKSHTYISHIQGSSPGRSLNPDLVRFILVPWMVAQTGNISQKWYIFNTAELIDSKLEVVATSSAQCTAPLNSIFLFSFHRFF